MLLHCRNTDMDNRKISFQKGENYRSIFTSETIIQFADNHSIRRQSFNSQTIINRRQSFNTETSFYYGDNHRFKKINKSKLLVRYLLLFPGKQ